jgi:hypothetical protein
MRELRTEIEIAAPVEKVWNILMEFDQWKEWNPIVNQASGTAENGAKIAVTMRGKNDKDGPKYAPTITHFEAPKSFRWRAKMMAGFLFTNDKIFELEESNSGTRLVHYEEFSGMLVPLFWSKMEKDALPMLKSMNDALKTVAEKN